MRKILILITWFALHAWPAVVDATKLPDGIGAPLGQMAEKDLSGAYFDGQSLWLVTNKKCFVWKVSVDESGIVESSVQRWKIAEVGDYEAVTHDGNTDSQTLLFLKEKKRSIVEYKFSADCIAEKGCPKKGRTWVLPEYMGESSSGLGAEGLTWVPESEIGKLLTTDESGFLCDAGCGDQKEKPENALDGLYLVAHQLGGFVYGFRLMEDLSVSLYGKYATGAEESAGLEYDMLSKRLYIWHGGKKEDIEDDETINSLEIVMLEAVADGESLAKLISDSLTPYRVADDIETNGPNLEGVAIRNKVGDLELFLTADGEDSPNNLFKVDLGQ